MIACAPPVPASGLGIAPLMPTRVNASRKLGFIPEPIRGCRIFHVLRVTFWSFVMRTSSVPNGDISAPPRAIQEPEQGEIDFGRDTETEAGAYSYAQELAKRTVMATQMDCRTVDAAIYTISRRYRLGSFVRKLWKSEPAVPRYDRVRRLERAYKDAMRSVQERLGL